MAFSAKQAARVLPFELQRVEARGRIVRLGDVGAEILARHDYPDPVAELLGELLALVSLIASALKIDGTVTMQARGDGAVSLLVADYQGPHTLRGYAEYDDGRVAQISEASDHPSVARMMGGGFLLITVDYGANTERYQGIVALEGETLADCAHEYFRASEQLPTAVRLTAEKHAERWQCAGLIIQNLPPDSGAQIPEPSALSHGDKEEDWRRAVILMGSVRNAELLAPDLSQEDLLVRLFHEEGVRAYPAHTIEFGCRCDEDRFANVIASFPEEDRQGMVVDGKIVANCQFCGAEYCYDPDLISSYNTAGNTAGSAAGNNGGENGKPSH